MADTVSVTQADRIAAIIRDYCKEGVRQEPFGGPLDTADLAARKILASTQPAPAFPREEVARQEMYAILRKWDVGDFASRVCSGKGHGSLPADICEAELDAFGESLIAALLQGKQP